MTAQSDRNKGLGEHRHHWSRPAESMRRYFLAAAVSLLTLAATATYLSVLSRVDGINGFELVSIPLFMLLFGWIAFSFLVATIGFLLESREEQQPDEASGRHHEEIVPKARTAILIPVFNEDPQRVCADIAAMIDSLCNAESAHLFDFFVLSDSTDPDVWLEEEMTWSLLSDKVRNECGVFYRHRAQNVARKSGNIADFCEHWGSRYPFMIVLDADSLLDGTTMIEMVRRMEADERLGILQVPCVPIGRWSVFARLQQFAAQAYGPVFTRGLAAWAGDQGNYWGHNAIIRVRPFMEHCDLPILAGSPPFGGEVLSHDFVEAALMVRAGWKVRLATDLKGSYEECPTTIADFAVRDQRWCQGNLQHLSILISEGFNPISRFHFANGIMSYVASPIWGLFMLVSLLGVLADRTDGALQESQRPIVSGELALFLTTLAMLLLPKLWGVVRLTGQPEELRNFGGATRLWASMFVETAASVLLSPIMAAYQSRFVWSAVRGKRVSWKAQQRSEKYVSWREASSQHWLTTALGILSVVVLALAAPRVLPWFAPLASGLLFSIPLAVFMGSTRMGRFLARLGILRIPEEVKPGYLVRQHQYHLANPLLDYQSLREESLLASVIEDPARFTLHARIQHTSEQTQSMPAETRSKLVSAYRQGTFESAAKERIREILLDMDLLEALHTEAQVRAAAQS